MTQLVTRLCCQQKAAGNQVKWMKLFETLLGDCNHSIDSTRPLPCGGPYSFGLPFALFSIYIQLPAKKVVTCHHGTAGTLICLPLLTASKVTITYLSCNVWIKSSQQQRSLGVKPNKKWNDVNGQLEKYIDIAFSHCKRCRQNFTRTFRFFWQPQRSLGFEVQVFEGNIHL